MPKDDQQMCSVFREFMADSFHTGFLDLDAWRDLGIAKQCALTDFLYAAQRLLDVYCP